MKFCTLLFLIASITPALAQDSKWSNDGESSFGEESEDSFDLSSIKNFISSVTSDAVSAFSKDEKKENAIKPAKVSVKVQIAEKSEVKRHWIHATFPYCFSNNKSLRSCNHSDCKGYSVTKTFSDASMNTFATVGIDPAKKEIIIAHRGTQNLKNWASNAQFTKTSMEVYKDLKVHSGFLGVLKVNEAEINKYVLDLLKDPKYKGFKTVFTGHSLGAAVATIHALRLHTAVKALGSKQELFAYHSPRVGDKKFAEYVSGLNMQIARYTNMNDPVSRLLTRSAGYAHILGEYHYPSKGTSEASVIRCDPTYDEDPACGVGEDFKLYKTEHHSYAFGINKNDFCQ
jgi:hypothetical protein